MMRSLTVEGYKPRARLQAQDESQSKPQMAARLSRQCQALGFELALVLADSLAGESKVNCVDGLDALHLPSLLAMRSNHALWWSPDQTVSQEPWQPFERTLLDLLHIKLLAAIIALIPLPLLPNLREGEPDSKSFSQSWERDLG